MIRLFVPDPLAPGAAVEPSADQARYLLTVMRLKAGDALELFNGRDGAWRAEVGEVSKRGCRLLAQSQTRPQAEGPDLDLIVALVKRARLETIVEKATELGARRIRLAITRRTQADHANVARLQAIAVEAAEQTGRLDAPQVLEPARLERLLDGWAPGRRLMFCDEAGDDPQQDWGGPAGRARPALQALAGERPGPWAVLIGPEGGFDPQERARLRALEHVAPVTLGPRILRADTAAISALTLWQAALGDWRATGTAPLELPTPKA
jgi:16S rRNA (uracil1498-N3)-methyltransferase